MSGSARPISNADIDFALGHTIALGGNLSVGGGLSISLLGATEITLPQSGTLVAQAGDIGSAGDVLISNGPGELPSFQELLASNVSGLGPFATASTITASNVSGLGPFATATAIPTSALSGVVALSNLPASVIGSAHYLGGWDAAANSPELASSTAPAALAPVGAFYIVTTAGATAIEGISSWNVGDWLIWDGTKWDKLDGQANPVASVNGDVGAVTITAAGLPDWSTAVGGFAVGGSVASNGTITLALENGGSINLGGTVVAGVSGGVLSLSGGNVVLTPSAVAALAPVQSLSIANGNTLQITNALGSIVSAGTVAQNFQPGTVTNLNGMQIANGDTLTTTGVSRYRMIGGLPGQLPTANQSLFDVLFVDSVTFPAGLSGSAFGCEVAPTNTAVYTLFKNGGSIGAATISPGATVGAWNFATDVTFAPGDRGALSLTTSPDPTLIGPLYALSGLW